MGLTHYWLRPTELPPDKFASAVQDIHRLLPTLNVPLAGFEGTGEPILTDDTLMFNGAGGAACEPFEVHAVEFDRHGRPEKRAYCKTEGLPYDRAVKAALIVLKHHLGDDLTVTSDQPDDAWGDAGQVVQRALGFGSGFRLDQDL